MVFPPELLPYLLPEEAPPEQYAIGRTRGRAEDIRDPLLRRSYLWANALTLAALEATTRFSGKFSGLSAGIVSLNPNQRPASIQAVEGFAFGIGVHFAADEARPGEVITVEVGGRAFPLAIALGPYEPHGLPPHPAGGTGTCWITSTNRSKWHHGILTCRHTLAALSLGASVGFQTNGVHVQPTRGHLADIDACTIDAAIVEIAPGDWPAGLSRLPICHTVAPGQSVSFQGRFGSGKGTVLRVFQDPIYLGNLFGQRVITDCSGGPGDSGSLLVDNTSGAGVGIYMGEIPDGQGGHEGMFQHLAQAATYFGFSTHL
ncbi:hypothetical protein [Hydrogenophaga sp. BPS33]|uniref:hypothetical protein n=1 Tax=Hydrogenophaga sp. BPS33 TaxID=2651974 RepID=UPI00135B2EA1|nr:hypothetical protein [Hydrogenophaga sp. BPS33]